MVERFNRTRKYEHLYREEIADVLELDAQVRAFRELYTWVRPHETLRFVDPARPDESGFRPDLRRRAAFP